MHTGDHHDLRHRGAGPFSFSYQIADGRLQNGDRRDSSGDGP